MKRILQINLDIVVEDTADGDSIANSIADLIEERNVPVLGACCTGDFTDIYKERFGIEVNEEEQNNEKIEKIS